MNDDGAVPEREGGGPRAHLPPYRRSRHALAAGQGHPQRRRHHLVGVGEVAGLLARPPVPLALRPVGPGRWSSAGTATSARTSSSSISGEMWCGERRCPAGTHVELPLGAAFGPFVAGAEGTVLLEVMMGDPRSWGDDPDRSSRLCGNGEPRRSPTRRSIFRRGSRTSGPPGSPTTTGPEATDRAEDGARRTVPGGRCPGTPGRPVAVSRPGHPPRG